MGSEKDKMGPRYYSPSPAGQTEQLNKDNQTDNVQGRRLLKAGEEKRDNQLCYCKVACAHAQSREYIYNLIRRRRR